MNRSIRKSRHLLSPSLAPSRGEGARRADEGACRFTVAKLS